MSEADSLLPIRNSIGVAAHILERDPEQLATQLTSRLPPGADVAGDRVLSSVARPGPWLRPVAASLASSAATGLQTVLGHSEATVWSTRESQVPTLFAVSPNGRWVASAGLSVRVWDSATWSLVAERRTPDCKGIGFAADGTSLAIGQERSVVVWDPDTGRDLAVHEQRVQSACLALSGDIALSSPEPAGSRSWTGAGGRSIEVWSILSGSTIAALEDPGPCGHHRPGDDSDIVLAAITPDRRLVLAGGGNGSLNVWDAASGRHVSCLDAHAEMPSESWKRGWRSMTALPDGRRFAVVDASGGAVGALRVWSINGDPPVEIAPVGVARVCAHPNGRSVIAVQGDGEITAFDVTGPDPIQRISGGRAVGTPAVTPDGRSIVTGSDSQTMCVWKFASGQTAERSTNPTSPGPATAASLMGETLVTGHETGCIVSRDVRSGEISAQLSAPPSTTPIMSVSTPAPGVVLGVHAQAVRVWREGAEPAVLEAGHPDGLVFDAAALTEDGWCFGRIGRETAVIDPRGYRRALLSGDTQWWGNRPVALITPDFSFAMAGGADGLVEVADLGPGTTARWLRGHTHAVCTMDAAPSGRSIATGSFDGTTRLWDLETMSVVEAWERTPSRLVRFSPCGSLLVSSGDSGTLAVRDVASGRIVAEGHTRLDIDHLVVSADGRSFAISSDYGGLELWGLPAIVRLAGFEADQHLTLAPLLSRSLVVALDRAGGIHGFVAENTEPGPMIVTRLRTDDSLLYRCPNCRALRSAEGVAPGDRFVCGVPGCGAALQSNPFTLRLRGLAERG